MNAWFARHFPPRMPSAIFDVPVHRMLEAVVRPSRRLLMIPLLTMPLLAGCNNNSGSRLVSEDVEHLTPKEQVADYRVAPCEALWQADEREATDNALFWLRAMDCAGRLTQPQARAQARQVAGSGWESAFKQGILLDNAGISQAERQQMLNNINLYRLDFPAALRPLIDTWRDKQTLFLALSDERLRYKSLLESTDKQLEAQRAEQGNLHYQLEITRKKLENLTDIERQLSARKQPSGEMPDGEPEHRNNAGAGRDSLNGALPPAGSATDKSTTEEPKKL
ncbi:two-component system QseEF-associated lipoprotein QseG [Brenneria populi]|uniref:Two-component system QseEF-associated lipoprotein QseG n=1 Tax=Brenneria populi TaxID=1505588 RepID=A0ABU6JQR7_9GAMM|nr:two-component system QseEF-associated lipoprotein QseG [Brenneria populi Li et al. 2015]